MLYDRVYMHTVVTGKTDTYTYADDKILRCDYDDDLSHINCQYMDSIN